MFKKPYLISMLLIAMLVLAACGSTNNEQPDKNEDENDSGQEVNDNNDEGNIEEEDKDEDKQDDENNNEEDEETNGVEGNEETDNTDQNNDEESDDFAANAKQVDSDEQDFSMQILPEYSLTSEEPGRDSLYLTDDGNIFMRIETMPADDEAYDYYNENVVSLLEAISVDGNPPTELTDENKIPQGEGIEKAVGYTVDTPEGITTGIVFEKDGLAIRLTIFDTKEQSHFDNFLQMGESITSK